MKTFAIALATLVTGCLAGTVNATAPVSDVRQRVVSYADLNLDNATDAAILFGRIKVAARRVCVSANPSPLAVLGHVQSCADEATARAVASVDAPMLTRHATGVDAPERVDFVRTDSPATALAHNPRGQVVMIGVARGGK